MRLEQLYYLVELSKTGSINRVSERNNISHQGISKSLLQLESEFGVQFFYRTAKGITLTPVGEEFVKRAQEILERVEKLNEFKPHNPPQQQSHKGNLSISVINSINKTKMPKIAVQFCKKYPKINLRIVEKLPEEIIFDVLNGTSELGLLLNINGNWNFSDQITANLSQLTFEKLSQEKLFILVGKTHPLASKNQISLKQIMKQPFIVSESAVVVNNYFASHGKLKIIHKSNSIEVMAKIISEGLAISYCPEVMLNDPWIKNELVKLQISEDPKIINFYIHSKSFQPTPIVQEFISILKSYY